jgi:hypothetical protein
MEVFPSSYMRPQNPQVISLIEGRPDETLVQARALPQQLQNQQTPATLPISINRVDYIPIIAIVGIIGLLSIIALLAYLKR